VDGQVVRAILFLLLVQLAGDAAAQAQSCLSAEAWLEAAQATHGQRLAWAGASGPQLFLLAVNRVTKSWSLALRDGRRGCIIDTRAGMDYVVLDEAWPIVEGTPREGTAR